MGEFRLRLRTLEKLLLQALNESLGNILDDDKVIDTLETLKREAAEITHKVEETNVVMKEVEQVTAEYLPLAQACSAVFFILEQLNLVNHFYQFSLRFFLDIFDYILHHNPNLKNVTDHGWPQPSPALQPSLAPLASTSPATINCVYNHDNSPGLMSLFWPPSLQNIVFTNRHTGGWIYVLSLNETTGQQEYKIGMMGRGPDVRLKEWRWKHQSKGFRLVYLVRNLNPTDRFYDTPPKSTDVAQIVLCTTVKNSL
ncbi:hypothetical protein D9758_018189 [Tetrapyrgos nigripes]|uniref:Dynein heavy chain ATP-binding dynein motor region domain-containing protein n=1 Tax=Tetrapyrgos nigripes TaxID=182062 RepID=A0A8H5BUD6_9AGAR|nr:hypothetical protein D9758_018189 [Tetrapyrgos nigripes]